MRIALVAMSGVRAHNPELTALGLSLPGFVERGKTIASLPSLGLLTLAALTDDRHDVDYRPANMTVRQLETGLVELGRYLYSEEATDRRRAGFKRQAEAGIDRLVDGRVAS